MPLNLVEVAVARDYGKIAIWDLNVDQILAKLRLNP
jgi:hypothetical protein